MARKRSLPALEYHISGQATARFFTADGSRKPLYFGKHGSPEAWAKYRATCEQYKNNDFVLPEDQPHHENLQDCPVLIRHVTAVYREHVKERYAQRERELSRLSNLCDDLDEFSGDCCVDLFGVLKLGAIRRIFIDRGWTRKYINRMVRETLRLFRYAATRELIDASIHTKLSLIEPLEEGFCSAPEGRETTPVDIEHVRKTAKHLSPVLRTMVELQAASGMRPTEV
jgi:hypothetical protein